MQNWSSPTFGQSPTMDIAVGQRAFMSRVYFWMFIGLGLTAAVSYYTATTPSLLRPVMQNFMVLCIGELALVFALSFLAQRMGGLLAGILFLAYSALNGLTLSGIFFVYRLGTIAEAFVLTAGLFGAMSLYATVTKRDLSGWGSFLFMGLLGVVIAGVINLFWKNDMLGFVTSCGCVVVFVGLTAYDTQKLRKFYYSASNGTSIASLSIIGALTLYLDFINLFLALLRLLGRRR